MLNVKISSRTGSQASGTQDCTHTNGSINRKLAESKRMLNRVTLQAPPKVDRAPCTPGRLQKRLQSKNLGNKKGIARDIAVKPYE